MELLDESDWEPTDGLEYFDSPEKFEALAHPLRLMIFAAAARRPLSAKEAAAEAEQPLPRVSYHVRALADAGLLRAVRQTRRRGAIETHYRAVATLAIDDEAFRRAPAEMRAILAVAVLSGLFKDVEREVRDGAAEDSGFLMSRSHFTVGRSGQERLHEEVRGFHRRLAELRDELAPKEGEEPQEVNTVLGIYRGAQRGALNERVWMGPEPGAS